mgnify:CR=1 FL=1
MITYNKGNIFESDTEALVNTVNTQGVMGKGLALQFKQAYPHNYSLYRKACLEGEVRVGKMFVTQDTDVIRGSRYIINFPTKQQWRKPSQYSYIQEGLVSLRQTIVDLSIRSIAVPPLGSSNGGLDWNLVKQMIVSALNDLDCKVVIYEPLDYIVDKMKKERVRLTPARAMLLDVLADMAMEGEAISEFAAEKVAYFLQKNGAQDQFNLKFNKAIYGPYSGKVRYVLNYLNGSYVMGMTGLSNHPFDEIWLTEDAGEAARNYLSLPENAKYAVIAEETKRFLRGYYSNYFLELLATISFLLDSDSDLSLESDESKIAELVGKDLAQWSNRKEKMFRKDEYIQLALNHLKELHSNT